MPDKPTKKTVIVIDRWRRERRPVRAVNAAMRDLVAELRPYRLTTGAGQSVTFELNRYGSLSVQIECTAEEFDQFMAQKAARKKADEVKADAVQIARDALREAKERDYSDEGMKRILGIE